MYKDLIKFFIGICVMLMTTSVVYANNLTISNVSLGARDPGTKTLLVRFNVQWENSWRNKINHDAVWLTIRLNSQSATPVNKKLCQILASGVNPTASSVGDGQNLEFYVPSDKTGAFLRRAVNGSVGNVTTQNAQLSISYDSCGFTDVDQVYASVLGVEMVYVPQGSFYAGDYNTSTASLNRGSADNNPWLINAENLISVANPVNNGFRYVSNSSAGEYATGSTFIIPANFPKGYGPFYIMKYELTEGQWVEFANSLPSQAARANRDLTDNNHKNSDGIQNRNTMACSGSPLVCSTTRPARPVSFLSWMDLVAFLDWNSLRPMTELEFEKVSRGPSLPNAGEYVWGTTNITAATTISGNEDGTEIITNQNANANFCNTTFSDGDAVSGVENQTGALRTGIFAATNSNRETAGASYYGVMDLGGNLKERVVTIGNAQGLLFTGVHGDGNLTNTSGHEGNSDIATWPGIDASLANGITGATGSGFHGGSWFDVQDRLRISDRQEASLTSASASNTFGGRGVRTYDGN